MWATMELLAIQTGVVALVFLLGAGCGALLNSMYRASMMEKTKADFEQKFLERLDTIESEHALRMKSKAGKSGALEHSTRRRRRVSA